MMAPLSCPKNQGNSQILEKLLISLKYGSNFKIMAFGLKCPYLYLFGPICTDFTHICSEFDCDKFDNSEPDVV